MWCGSHHHRWYIICSFALHSSNSPKLTYIRCNSTLADTVSAHQTKKILYLDTKNSYYKIVVSAVVIFISDMHRSYYVLSVAFPPFTLWWNIHFGVSGSVIPFYCDASYVILSGPSSTFPTICVVGSISVSKSGPISSYQRLYTCPKVNL